MATTMPSATPVPVNPVIRQRADSQVFRHTDGFYYMTGSVPEYDRLVLRRSPTLAGLSTAGEAVLWRHLAAGPLSGFIWAPELHLINGRWTMYFAAGPSGGGEDVFRIRTYAIVCDGRDPMTGKWSLLGQLKTPWDTFTLDSTSFVHRGRRYLCWAQREPGIETNSNLYLAPLATALTLAQPPARLSVPTLDWEIQGFKVNEAPALLARHDKLFLTYSASATDSRYCLGMLTCDAGADIMSAASWSKSRTPVLTTSPSTGVFGPGHNSFTVDEAGRDILVYHGRDYDRIQGDPLFDPNRHTRMQRIYYRADGSPDFGLPVGNGPIPDRFSPLGQAGRYLMLSGETLGVGTGPIAATQLRSMGDDAGLQPIIRRDRRIAVMPGASIGLAVVGDPATRLRVVPGLAGSGVSIRPTSSPGEFVQAAGDRVIVGPARTAAERRAASFTLS